MTTSEHELAHLGRGVPSPFRPLHGRLAYQSFHAVVAASITDILSTRPGERVMRPDYGAGLSDFVFAPNSPVYHRRIEQRVLDALNRWEPRAIVERVEAKRGRHDQEVLIDIDYVIRRTNTAHNQVYPFYLSEGA